MDRSKFTAILHAYDTEAVRTDFVGKPEKCPECDQGQAFDNPFIVRRADGNSVAIAFYQCRMSRCRSPFFGIYIRPSGRSEFCYEGMQVPTYISSIEEIPELIDEISPMYRKIFTQAHAAESSELELIMGCGYRKALEFLMKDYAIHLVKNGASDEELSKEQVEKIETIKEVSLMNVIANHLKIPSVESRVKSMAERAVWLGNDESHYEKRFENSDIEDMKMLMTLTIKEIESQQIMAALEKKYPNTKKSK